MSAWKKLCAEHLREENLHAVLGEPLDVGAAPLEFVDVADRHAEDPLGRQHVGPAVVPVDFGDVELVGSFEVALQLRRARRLAHEIEFMLERLLELGHDFQRTQAPRLRPVPLGKFGEREQHLEIAADHRVDIGSPGP